MRICNAMGQLLYVFEVKGYIFEIFMKFRCFIFLKIVILCKKICVRAFFMIYRIFWFSRCCKIFNRKDNHTHNQFMKF